MEAFGDAVLAGEAPHSGHLLFPVRQGLAQGPGEFEAAGFQGLDERQELWDQAAAFGRGLPADAQQGAELLLQFVDGLEGRLLPEHLGELDALLSEKTVAAGT